MTTRKKATDTPKPPTKRARKKASPGSEGGLFSDAQAESPEFDSEVPPQVLDSEVAKAVAVASARSELAATSIEGPASPPTPIAPMATHQGQINVAAQSWFLTTNHLNLLYMLAAGMVMGPAGFAGKHYRDPSSGLSGLIPIFHEGVPELAIQQATSEQKHLRPCIAELDLTGLSGQVRLVARNGEVSTGTLPLSIGSEIGALLMRAPLPMALVKRLLFRSPADRKEFETSARNFANIDLSDLSIEVAEQRFSSTQPMLWPLSEQPDDTVQGAVDRAPARGDAIGGGLAMLYQFANRSDLCCSVYRVASGAGDADDCSVVQRDPVLAELMPWVESGALRPESSVQARLFWGAIQALVDARLRGSTEKPVDTVLGFLDDQLSSLQEAGYRSRLERLIADMRSTFGLGGGTISQLFEHHKGTLSRPLLLFCLRERCVDLLEFSHPDLSDEELVLAAILFGVREGWIGLPVELRAAKELSRFVEHRMFVAEWSQRGIRLSLDTAPPRPIPLRELLKTGESTWSEERNASLAKLASRLGWHDCITSRIRLSQGQYRLNITPDGVEVVVRGDIRPPVVVIDRDGLLKRISQWPPLPRALEDEVRTALGSRD